MCGIVAGVSAQNVVPVLVQGLARLEYRGYDSCGIAVFSNKAQLEQLPGLQRARSTSRVSELAEQVFPTQPGFGLEGILGIAHTRWATHGAPHVDNAHPHFSVNAKLQIGLVHNGIIENYEALREDLKIKGYVFESQTDTEVIAHLIHSLYQGDLYQAFHHALRQLKGAYALAVICNLEPDRLVGARAGSPLVFGVSRKKESKGHYLASDAMALAGVVDEFVFLEEGDTIDVRLQSFQVVSALGGRIERVLRPLPVFGQAAQLGPYQHYMQKEIFEQPQAISDTLEGVQGIVPELFDLGDMEPKSPRPLGQSVFQTIDRILLLACGTSYYSASTAKYWLESIAKIPTQVEIASEYRYRESVPDPKTLVVCISQSGETADTLAALKHAQSLGMTHTLSICNVSTSAMVRECALAYITRAGVEVGVASTKAFTTQLAALFLLTLVIAKTKGHLSAKEESRHLHAMRHLPAALQAVLSLEPQIMAWAQEFKVRENALFLGRGLHYPIALEGALKLKEISYIHAEAYPAGELKHGPLALVTEAMPVVTVAPNDALLEKLKSNMQEVRARGGVLYVLADADTHISSSAGLNVIRMPEHYGELSPILHVVPLQLLAYHTALARGSDVDKPRNLAKSVT
ncbi:MAG: glutamine--fructose-6-phosphate transaminase (isomerizing), partial [Burkholderiaceae bacterium]